MPRPVHELYTTTSSGGASYGAPEQDFAFADTVIATDEDIPTAPLSGNPMSQPPPVSGPQLRETDPWTGQLYETRPHYPRQTALTGPPPPPSLPPNAGPVTMARTVFHRAKHELDSNRHDLKDLWKATYDEAEAVRLANEEDPFVRLAGKLRRVRALLAFFEWDRADLMRAAWIGVAVFVIVATVGAFALQR